MSKRLEHGNTDLIPGEYEGGAKVWECSLDLCHYLTAQLLDNTNYDNNNTNDTTTINILKRIISCAFSTGINIWEIGCGHALLACILYQYALQHSILIKQVLLSDYNDFVLRQLTCPNIMFNSPQQQQQQQQHQRIIIANDNQHQNEKKNLDNNNNNVVLFASGD